MKAAAHREEVILGWKEATFQSHVVRLAKAHGWWPYHVYDSRRSEPGYPDLTLLHRQHGLIFRELKAEKGRVKPTQWLWLHGLIDADQDAAIWRPSDWIAGTIQQQLQYGSVRSAAA